MYIKLIFIQRSSVSLALVHRRVSFGFSIHSHLTSSLFTWSSRTALQLSLPHSKHKVVQKSLLDRLRHQHRFCYRRSFTKRGSNCDSGPGILPYRIPVRVVAVHANWEQEICICLKHIFLLLVMLIDILKCRLYVLYLFNSHEGAASLLFSR